MPNYAVGQHLHRRIFLGRSAVARSALLAKAAHPRRNCFGFSAKPTYQKYISRRARAPGRSFCPPLNPQTAKSRTKISLKNLVLTPALKKGGGEGGEGKEKKKKEKRQGREKERRKREKGEETRGGAGGAADFQMFQFSADAPRSFSLKSHK